MRMPSTRNEEYRFTDLSPVLNSSLALAPADAAVDAAMIEQLALPEAAGGRIVLVNGVFRPELSDLSGLLAGCYIGGSAGAPADAVQQLVSVGCSNLWGRGDMLFQQLFHQSATELCAQRKQQLLGTHGRMCFTQHAVQGIASADRHTRAWL
jgi:hypothetical protein